MSKKIAFENQAKSIIEKLKIRNMEGFYCEDRESAKNKILELIGNDRKTVTYGGSVSLDEIGIKDAVEDNGHNLLRREKYNKTPEEKAECYAKQVMSDVFLMSTNAITLNGELVNIDGNGNRVACLICGPKEVIVLAGMNKIVSNIEEGVNRARNIAAPANTVRLGCKTPCAQIGKCANCLASTICRQIVITRASSVQGRIKVVLVGEELGY